MDRAFADAQPALGIWRYWPLRFLLYFVVLIAAYAGCQLLPIFAAPHLRFIPADILSIGFVALGIAILIAVYRILVRWTEKRAADELGASGSIPLFAGGTIIGIALFCAVCTVLWFYGAVSFRGINTSTSVISAACGALLAGVGEEIAFRGGVYRLLEEGFGTLVAIILSGAMFGVIHAGNRGATTASSIAIALEAGVLLAAAYTATRSLWLPIGLHFGWNFTEGGIFGAAVSGGKSSGLIATTFSGPDKLTGGIFGPEASVPAVAVCLTAALALLVLTVRRGQWQPVRLRLHTE